MKDCFKFFASCLSKQSICDHQAKNNRRQCILCGKCTLVCPQNAKKVHSEKDSVLAQLASGAQVVASVAPSFISNFDVNNFAVMSQALKQLGFDFAEETSVGAKAVTEEYAKLLQTHRYKNLISSACPAINRMLQLYYPKALQYLAPVASPMIAHAKMLKKRYPQAKIVFIGPCIAKKREANESGLIDGVLTFEELQEIFNEKNVTFDNLNLSSKNDNGVSNKAKFYPISRGIIKSFESLPTGYEYIAVDGVERSFEYLKILTSFDLFIEVTVANIPA